MLRFQNLQRARLLEQQGQNVAARAQALRNDFTEFKSSKMFSLKDANVQSRSAQSLTFKNSNETVTNALLL